MSAMGHWITAPNRLPWVVVGLIAASTAALIAAGFLVIGYARVNAATTATAAAQKAANATACQILAMQADPSLPPPSTDRGKASIKVYRAAYGNLGCRPVLLPQRP